MCGIVGLLIKKPELRHQLGTWMLPMLVGMTERGPDSAGVAVFGDAVDAGLRKISLCTTGTEAFDWPGLSAALKADFGSNTTLAAQANHAIVTTDADPVALRAWVAARDGKLRVLSVGRAIDLYKDLGLPADVAARYSLGEVTGSHVVAHTRMATESAVTIENGHPFTAGEDWCILHNGSLSNPYSLRRKLEKAGIGFDGDCDTEAACRFLEWRMREGDSLESAIHQGFSEFDGFYTFLMGTRDELALVRDAFACKPAIVAETDDYVAIASEFRSLAHLPGIDQAKLFEPVPERIYVWKVAA
jgi:amidophosphoribosyltransferase